MRQGAQCFYSSYLSIHQTPEVSLLVGRKVWVGQEDVSVDMMAHNVLVQPTRERASGKEVQNHAAKDLPHARDVGGSPVRAVMHHMQKHKRLADSKHCCCHYLKGCK